ncbi:MAG: Cys-tRNA(Pro) deacylase [Clostridia bacterium]|nr:Cys-tRNA(Pro) deacylase [Clostridia bacterium]
MKPQDKTNALRLMDASGETYITHTYDPDTTDGESVAALLHQEADKVFKTLVTVAPSRKNYVFIVPVNCTLNLKKAARAAKEKSIVMIPQKELLPLTGYIHGGCSPLGMKKLFPTFLHETAQLFDTICVSAGRRGFQMEVDPEAILRMTDGAYADLTD